MSDYRLYTNLNGADLRWEVPPHLAGQTVEIAFCAPHDALKRVTDRSISAGAHEYYMLVPVTDDDRRAVAAADATATAALNRAKAARVEGRLAREALEDAAAEAIGLRLVRTDGGIVRNDLGGLEVVEGMATVVAHRRGRGDVAIAMTEIYEAVKQPPQPDGIELAYAALLRLARADLAARLSRAASAP
ncbi:MAG: hypothetical protein ABIR65_01215 [Pseudolysinimonas sp.]